MWATVWRGITLRKFEERSHLAETNIHLLVNKGSLVFTKIHLCSQMFTFANEGSLVFTNVHLPVKKGSLLLPMVHLRSQMFTCLLTKIQFC